jgi:hypothetical protein
MTAIEAETSLCLDFIPVEPEPEPEKEISLESPLDEIRQMLDDN